MAVVGSVVAAVMTSMVTSVVAGVAGQQVSGGRRHQDRHHQQLKQPENLQSGSASVILVNKGGGMSN